MKTGRPKLKNNEKKTELVGMTVSLADKQKILAAAKKAGISVSVFMFNCIKEHIY